jgi:predicted enzyme related to lactoylglutathione lyase
MAGKIVHFEVPASDTGRARSFWSGGFGWDFGDSAMPGMEYYMVRTGEDQGGAVLPSTGPFRLTIYFDTDDVDASLEKVREHGGTSAGKQPIPHVGWFAHCKDTEGNEFSVFQSDESVTG